MADLGGSQDGVPDCFCDELAQVVDGLRSVVLAGFEFGGEEAGQGVAQSSTAVRKVWLERVLMRSRSESLGEMLLWWMLSTIFWKTKNMRSIFWCCCCCWFCCGAAFGIFSGSGTLCLMYIGRGTGRGHGSG